MKAQVRIRLAILVLIIGIAGISPDASAITVATSFVGGTAPENAAGGGDLARIVEAAAKIWESAYVESGTLTIYYGWAPLDQAGNHTLIEQGGTPNRELAGLILFDNSGKVAFYMDPTPESHEEYKRLTEENMDLGGGRVNVARLFSSPIGNAVDRVDLFSVALHEMGHALGLCNGNATFIEDSRDGILRIAESLPYAGTVVPLATNIWGFTSHFDPLEMPYGAVMQGLNAGERRIPSSLDILADAQISGFGIRSLNPLQEPVTESSEPDALEPEAEETEAEKTEAGENTTGETLAGETPTGPAGIVPGVLTLARGF